MYSFIFIVINVQLAVINICNLLYSFYFVTSALFKSIVSEWYHRKENLTGQIFNTH